jgi:hypothetical protein
VDASLSRMIDMTKPPAAATPQSKAYHGLSTSQHYTALEHTSRCLQLRPYVLQKHTSSPNLLLISRTRISQSWYTAPSSQQAPLLSLSVQPSNRITGSRAESSNTIRRTISILLRMSCILFSRDTVGCYLAGVHWMQREKTET